MSGQGNPSTFQQMEDVLANQGQIADLLQQLLQVMHTVAETNVQMNQTLLILTEKVVETRDAQVAQTAGPVDQVVLTQAMHNMAQTNIQMNQTLVNLTERVLETTDAQMARTPGPVDHVSLSQASTIPANLETIPDDEIPLFQNTMHV